jgi:Fe-S cluster assembly ATP-binding protein
MGMAPNDRARGVFLAFQYPHTVPGVTMANFLRTAVNSVNESPCRRVSSGPKCAKRWRC